MSKHTPGPWSIFTDDKHKHNAGIEAENFSIVTIGYFDETPGIDDSGVKGNTEEEALANAHLIAAAPDLLEALEKCAAVIGAPQEGHWATDDEVNDAYDSAVAAINKAKGEQL
ncbi:hypothetical protein UFOVP673_37 [uncultured Caudovirales phage]|uniref:Uncharacterized protein n=1 Tax=uncultured Caudovirales phage TaxID=2100421 RepID=A0A6J5NL44_9CAUD|nr:hypothetical protein UFOVP673_37 [uncultured Caudovirales phage]